ncbi:MAG: Na(+)-translocating NADH-quinone reductase subunit A [Flavobacteriaceae bacterium]|nr:Na(+)-translocating NADH-quinone reductase subunit A [Flavobacteriaceae bacterium]
MSKDIRIRKGLDIRLLGEAEKKTSNAIKSKSYSIKPGDFQGVTPKILAKEGMRVQAGEALFFEKTNEAIMFPSPVSGEVTEIKRGERRKIVEIKVTADEQISYKDFGIINPDSMKPEDIKAHLLAAGCWPFMRQRPYDVMASPEVSPKAIFVSAYASAPLAADYDYVLEGKGEELQAAITAIGKLTEGLVHVSVGKNSNTPFNSLSGITLHKVSGPHPSGNVSTQIAKIDPINKGEIVWTISPQDLVIIGELILTGKFNAERIIACGGSVVKKPKYYKTRLGSEVATMVYDAEVTSENIRIISGDVLTGTQQTPEGHLGYFHNAITVIPEGNDYEFFGWNKPVFNKISPSRALTFSWMFPKRKYDLNTNTNGEHRAFVVTGSYEEVFPLDIYPMQLMKACMVNDLDAMEQLGMYEVAPEDFALTEFICVSKQPHQQIIRDGLDLMLKEIG